MTHTSFLRLPLLIALAVAVLATGCSKEGNQTRSLERARQFFDAGELEKAKIEHLSILQANRNETRVFAPLGLIWSQQGCPLQALPYLRRARELDLLPVSERMPLVYAYMAAGMVTEARAEAEAVLQVDPADSDALLFMADTIRSTEEGTAELQRLEQFPFKEAAAYHLATATLSRKMRRLPEAEQAVDRALAADPDSATAHLAKAAFLQGRKEMEEAGKHLERGSELAPLRSQERLKFIDFKAQSGEVNQVNEAKDMAKQLVDQAPDYVPALALWARMTAAVKDYDGALKILERLFAIDKSNLEGRFLQVDVLVAKDDKKQAIEVLQRLDQHYGGQPLIQFKLARTQVAAGEYKAAGDLLKQLLIKAQGTAEVEASLLLAEVNLRSGNPAAVVPAMQALLEKYPHSREASLLLVRALEAQRRFEEAIAAVRGLLEKTPDDVSLRASLAVLHVQAEDYVNARAAYENVLTLVPHDLLAWRNLVELDMQEGDTEAALNKVADRSRLEPDSPLVPFIEGRVRVARQEWDAAEAALLKTLEMDPDFPRAHEALSRIYAAQSKLPEAAAKVQERLAANPADHRALWLLAQLHTEQAEYTQAAETYERLRGMLDTPGSLLLNNLASIYSDHLNRLDDALALARQARALRPSVDGEIVESARQEAAFIADTLGWILYRKKEYAEALSLLREAATALGNHPEVQAHLGLAAAAMGDTLTAETALAKAVSASVDFAAKEEAQQRLALLQNAADQGEETVSREALAALAAATPDDPVWQLRLAAACEKEHSWAEAAQAYKRALARNPSLAIALKKLAELYAGPLDDSTAALEWARKAREAAPDDPKVVALLGQQVFKSGDHPWSFTLLSEATQRGEDSPSTWLAFARAAYSVGQVAVARSAMETVVAAGNAEKVAEAKRFILLTGASPPAPEDVEAALAQDPNNVPALMLRADSQARSGQQEATVLYSKILEIYPNFAPAMARLAALLADAPASRARATALALKAREILADDPNALEALALLAFHRKDMQHAIDLLLEAGRQRPLGPDALFLLGRAHYSLNNEREAREALTSALAAGLPESKVSEANRLLSELESQR